MVKRGNRKSKPKNIQNKKVVPQSKNKKETPIAIKIISILFYIGGVLSGLLGLMALMGGVMGGMVFAVLGAEKIIELVPGLSIARIILGSIILSTMIVFGVFLILWGILDVFIGRGLWKRQRWAYIAAVMIVMLGFIKFLFALILGWSALIGLGYYGIIGYFLMFNKEVKEFFTF